MEIRVTNTHKFKLDQSLNTEDRLTLVNSILQTIITLDDLTTTVEDYFKYTWDKNNTRICLDIIGYYLSKSVENRNKHDKEVMSWEKEKQMRNGNSNYTPFSSLNKKDSLSVGLNDFEDEDSKKNNYMY